MIVSPSGSDCGSDWSARFQDIFYHLAVVIWGANTFLPCGCCCCTRSTYVIAQFLTKIITSGYIWGFDYLTGCEVIDVHAQTLCSIVFGIDAIVLKGVEGLNILGYDIPVDKIPKFLTGEYDEGNTERLVPAPAADTYGVGDIVEGLCSDGWWYPA